jgi:hypothetical protein
MTEIMAALRLERVLAHGEGLGLLAGLQGELGLLRSGTAKGGALQSSSAGS